MNIFVGACALILSTFLGYIISQKYRLKKDFYSFFSTFNKSLLTDIGFYQKSLLSIFDDYKINNAFTISAKKYVINGELDINEKYLSADDIDFFEKYLKELGYGDKSAQIKHLTIYEGLISDKLKIAVENEKKYRSLFLKLGFLIGLIIFIVVI